MEIDKKDESIRILSHNILYLRKSSNITKKEMARILGIGIKTLNNVEQGILPPRLSVEILFRIYKLFGVSIHLLLSEKLGD